MRGVLEGTSPNGVETDEYSVRWNDKYKLFLSPGYNFYFDKKTGYFARWGETHDEDPEFSPFGPEILDLEISVNGCPNNCKFCYKSNTNLPATNMDFDTFKAIIDKMPPTLTQIAFGITGVKTNPHFLDMLEYTKKKGIIPNFTLTGIDLDEIAAGYISMFIGACAVSVYPSDKDLGYMTVSKFKSLGIKQTNIHLMVAEETLDHVYSVVNDYNIKVKPHAIVLLGVKPKGRAAGHFTPLRQDEFNRLVTHCLKKDVPIGFDSCSAPKFIKFLEYTDKPLEWKERMLQLVEPCESSLFSAYINVKGEYWNCSFCEGEYAKGIVPVNVLDKTDFVSEVWYSPEVAKFRHDLIHSGRKCIPFPDINQES